ncbi:hypothetical protein [Streptomyces sp. cmx-4-9]|uniref:hypothetical protein n=1 Tax=Streptomyces sp. cmx-4-9 TaxID=2790941 RepID=UPI00397FA4A7
MSIVKNLPEAAIPEGGAPAWNPADARRWRDARVPWAFAPTFFGWALVPLVLLAITLLAAADPGDAHTGTAWLLYPGAVLLVALPGWYRHLPAATLVSAPLIALDTVLRMTVLGRLGPADGPGGVLLLALCAWAFTGALLRLRSRRRQRALVRAAAAGTRRPVPSRLTHGHRRRGLLPITVGGALCLAAAALLGWGLAADLRADGTGAPYDAVGQQVGALLLLAFGTPALGRGIGARRAARRLHDGPQPVLRVGVRNPLTGPVRLVADARSTSAEPLAAFRDRFRDSHGPGEGRVLVSGPEGVLRTAHHDIDPRQEPFEALMYGEACEGAEVVLEYALYAADTRIVSAVTTAPLLPARRLALPPWRPAGTSYTLRTRAQDESRRVQRAARLARGDHGGTGHGCGTGSSCGGSDGGSSCGGGCGGGGD